MNYECIDLGCGLISPDGYADYRGMFWILWVLMVKEVGGSITMMVREEGGTLFARNVQVVECTPELTLCSA